MAFLEKDRAEAEAQKEAGSANPASPYAGTDGKHETPTANDSDPKTAKKTKFFGHVATDATRFFRCTDDIEKEILKHLNAANGTKVKITIHIEADSNVGFNPDAERTLRENGRTLGFGSIEFD